MENEVPEIMLVVLGGVQGVPTTNHISRKASQTNLHNVPAGNCNDSNTFRVVSTPYGTCFSDLNMHTSCQHVSELLFEIRRLSPRNWFVLEFARASIQT